MKKRLLSILLSISITLLFLLPSHAATPESDSNILFTPELAESTAEKFSSNLGKKYHAISTTKIYAANEQAIGYIVNLQDDNNHTGHIVFDNTKDSLISEFSFDEPSIGSKNHISSPYIISGSATFAPLDSSFHKKMSSTCGTTKTYKVGPFTYETRSPRMSANSNYLFPFGKHTSTWDDIFVPVKTIYENYNLVGTNHISDFYTLPEDLVKETTKHYACAVSASYICGSYYEANLGCIDESLKDEYMDIWARTKTTVRSIRGGITYGTTPITDITPGINSYLKSKNKSARGTYVESPSYSKFTKTIDSHNIAMIHCGINTDEGRSGHSMAVEGYCTIAKKYDHSQLHTLMACDGWDGPVKYINLDYSYFTDYQGTFFHE